MNSNHKNQKTSNRNLPLRIIPLGGVGEVTKNMYVYEYGEHQIIVDCGIGFPQESVLGVDFLIPDITYLEKNHKKIMVLSSLMDTWTILVVCPTFYPDFLMYPSTVQN